MNPEEFEEDIEIEIDEDDEFVPGNRPHRRMVFRGSPGMGNLFEGGSHRRIWVEKMKKHGKARKGKGFSRMLMTAFTEEDDQKVMYVVLPGVDKSTLEVNAKKRAILIEGSYLPEAKEMFGEKISHKIHTPFEINPDKIDASYKAGILRLLFLGIEDPTVKVDVIAEDD